MTRSRLSSRYVRLSKAMSFLLRHRPQAGRLHLDEEGFVPLANLLKALHSRQGLSWVSQDDVLTVVESGKRHRFEVRGDRIRARYGHSLVQRIPYPVAEPPTILYQGTARRNLSAIRREGLRSMRRQYVHLTSDPLLAVEVGRRHDPHPVVLRILAHQAWQDGLIFHQVDETIYLTEQVPTRYIVDSEHEGAPG